MRPEISGPVLVLYSADEALAGGHDSEAVQGVVESAEAIEAAIRAGGWTAEKIGVQTAHDVFTALQQIRPALVFNLVESLQGRSELESASAFLLEMGAVRYTGSGPLCLALSQDKPIAKATLRGLGLPVAAGCVLTQGETTETQRAAMQRLRFPCIVKPAATDASHGIEPASVVQDTTAALARAEYLWLRYGPQALCEEFIVGREINAAIVGTGAEARCLPLSEIDFRLRPGLPNIVTYAAKWIDGSEEWGNSEVLCPAPVSKQEAAALEEAALGAYRAFGCRDYGRVDLRLRPSGEPVLLEVNPNPDLAPTAGLARSAGKLDWSYDELIHRILFSAAQRPIQGASSPA